MMMVMMKVVYLGHSGILNNTQKKKLNLQQKYK